MIRKTANIGDIVVGLSTRCERIIYAMRITDKLTFPEYWSSSQYLAKRSDWDSPIRMNRRGDNIYEPDGQGGYIQHRSNHWDHGLGQESLRAKRKDTGVNAVLVSTDFAYWGGSGPLLCEELYFLHIVRGHRCKFSPEEVASVALWFEGTQRGVHYSPTKWPSADTSWRHA